MSIALKILFWPFAIAYVFALIIFLIGHFGLFGAKRDPLACLLRVISGLTGKLQPMSALPPESGHSSRHRWSAQKAGENEQYTICVP